MVAITATHAGTPSLQVRLLQARAIMARQEADMAQVRATQLRQQATQAEQVWQDKRATAQMRTQDAQRAESDSDSPPEPAASLGQSSFLQRLASAKDSLSIDAYMRLDRIKAKAVAPTRSTLLHIRA